MNQRHLFFLTAIFCTIPFLTAPFFGWISLICFVPFLCIIISPFLAQCTATDFFCWSFVSTGLVLLPIALVIYQHAQGDARLVVWFFLVAYLSATQMFVFVIAQWLALKWNNERITVLFFCLALSLYSYFLYRFSLIIFGWSAGLPMCLFFIPLFFTATPLLLSSITVEGLILLLIALQGVLALFVTQKKYSASVITLFFLIIILYAGHTHENKPAWLQHIATLNVLNMEKTTDPWQRAHDILDQLEQIKRKDSTIALIIAPESTFTWPINKCKQLIEMWSEYGLNPNRSFIIGTQRIENNKYLNSAVLLKQSRITQIYDKITPLIFTERPALYCNFNSLCTFFTTKKVTCQGTCGRTPFYADNSTIPPLFPFICSELFFAYQKPYTPPVTVLGLINDSWFSMHASLHLLVALARLNALRWNTDILYISHYFQLFISKRGIIYHLN